MIVDGFYHLQLALTSVPVDPVKQKTNFRLAYEKYLSGAERFPKDDEVRHSYWPRDALLIINPTRIMHASVIQK